jgi:CBS domain-containing protein
MKVQDILTDKGTTVVTTTRDVTLEDACQLLANHNIGALLVVNERQEPEGIISERDIVRMVAVGGQTSLLTSVAEVMSMDIVVALPEDELNYLSNVMTQKRIRHLPVMQDGVLIGIVSIGDVVKAQLHHFEGEALTLRQYITGGLL